MLYDTARGNNIYYGGIERSILFKRLKRNPACVIVTLTFSDGEGMLHIYMQARSNTIREVACAFFF